MAFKEPKDMSGLVALAEQVGWSVRKHNQQVTIYPPGDHSPVTVGTRDGDFVAYRNARARLRRVGLFDAAVQHLLDRAADAREIVDRERTATEARIQQINTHAAAAAAEQGAPAMPRGKEELHALAARCEAVGWTTRTIGNDKSHILITPPGKRPITIAFNNGQRGYLTTVIAQLTRAGLLDAEAKMGLRAGSADSAPDDDLTDEATPGPAEPDADEPDADEPDAGEPETLAPAAPRGVEAQPGDVPGGITEVRGIKVAEWGPARTPVGAVDNKATELLLEDGSIVYGCHLGDFTGVSWQSVAKHRKAMHPELLGHAARRRAELAAEKLAASHTVPEPTPQVPATTWTPPAPPPPLVSLKPAAAPSMRFQPPTATEAPVAAPAAASAVAPAAPAAPARPVEPPMEPRRVQTAPPAVRAGISTVAAATPKPAVAPVSPAGAPMDLPTMVARMRQLAGIEAERAKLQEENEQLRRQLDGTQRDLEVARKQGANLAEQCISKDSEIRRLRAQAKTDADAVAAAQELQKVMSQLMGGSPVQLAA
jgi:hypothetical protein